MKLDIKVYETIIKILLLTGMAIATCLDSDGAVAIGIIILFIEQNYIVNLIKTVLGRVYNIINNRIVK